MKKILFVCTGNTCRSPMAEGFFKAALASDSELAAQYVTASSGISAFDGDSASLNAVQAMREDWNIDIKGHRSKSAGEDEIRDAFLILVMTRSHKDAVISMFPEAHQKVFTLKEYVYDKPIGPDFLQYDYSMDISDPYGMSSRIYSRCAMDIKQAVEKLVEKLINF